MESEGRLFPVEHIGHRVRHPDIVLQVADQLHDEGRLEEAGELIEASELFLNVLGKHLPDDAA